MFPLLIGSAIRIVAVCFFYSVSNHDTIGWALIGDYTLQGKNIYPYPATSFYGFFPLYLYICAAATWLQNTGVPFMVTLKMVSTVFDIGNIYLIYLLSKKNNKITWLYALNPISIITVSIHGQFESMPVFFLLLAIYLLHKEKPVWSAIALSVAVALKTWPVLFAVPLLKKAGWKFAVLIPVIPLIAVIVYTVFYQSNLADLLRVTLLYRGISGNFGIGYIFGPLFINQVSMKVFSNLFLLTILWFSLFNARKTYVSQILDQMLLFFMLSPTMALQYMMWIAPFIILESPKLYWLFIITATLYIGSANLYWIFDGAYPFFSRYTVQLGVAVWVSLLLIIFFRKVNIKKEIAFDIF